MRILPSLLCCGSILAMAGCSIFMDAGNDLAGRSGMSTAGTADAALARDLDEAMRRAAAASARVAGLEITAANKRGGIVLQPPVGAVPEELRSRISIEWTGPVEPLLAALADEIGYRMAVTGSASAQPVMISMSRLDEPVWHVFRDIGMAIGTEGAVVVDATSRRVEFRRAATDR